LVERNLAKVEVESSRLFSRSRIPKEATGKQIPGFFFICSGNDLSFNAGVAQLVERNLAKVEVESSRLFSRSRFLEAAREFVATRFSFTVTMLFMAG
jgi:hypothetical protein